LSMQEVHDHFDDEYDFYQQQFFSGDLSHEASLGGNLRNLGQPWDGWPTCLLRRRGNC
jgi:hypothetical protein